MSYTKITGTITNAENLLSVLRTNLVTHGWTESFYGDNIISTINLGKKVIFKKGLIYLYVAASDNNNPTGDTSSFITNGISCLKFCCSTNLNTANNWFSNNSNGTTSNEVSGIEFKSDKPFKLYINNSNFILVSNFGTGLYSTMMAGDISDNVFYAKGDIDGVNITGSRLVQTPFLRVNNNYPTFFKSGVFQPWQEIRSNNFSSSIDIGYPSYITDRNNTNGGHINRADSPLYDISMAFDIMFFKYYGVDYFCYMPDIYIVNFKSLTPESTILTEYDVYPFLQKQSPQVYNNDSNWGQGFAIKRVV